MLVVCCYLHRQIGVKLFQQPLLSWQPYFQSIYKVSHYILLSKLIDRAYNKSARVLV